MKEWYDMCIQSGIADFLLFKSLLDCIPEWMNEIEVEYYKAGFNLAEKLCVSD